MSTKYDVGAVTRVDENDNIVEFDIDQYVEMKFHVLEDEKKEVEALAKEYKELFDAEIE